MGGGVGGEGVEICGEATGALGDLLKVWLCSEGGHHGDVAPCGVVRVWPCGGVAGKVWSQVMW